MPVSLHLHFTGSALDQGTAIVDGYNSYYAFSRRSGYSGKVNVPPCTSSDMLF